MIEIWADNDYWLHSLVIAFPINTSEKVETVKHRSVF